jgi:hypothetical protein
MSKAKKDQPQTPREIIDASGFAFQLAVERLVKRLPKPSKWRVIAGEFGWRNRETNGSGYIDIVLEYDKWIYVPVECKRTQDASWVFLSNVKSMRATNVRVTGRDEVGHCSGLPTTCSLSR